MHLDRGLALFGCPGNDAESRKGKRRASAPGGLRSARRHHLTRDATDATLHYRPAPPGALGGPGWAGPAPVVDEEPEVGGMLMPLPAAFRLSLPDAKTNSSTTATKTAAATQPHTAVTSPELRPSSGRS